MAAGGEGVSLFTDLGFDKGLIANEGAYSNHASDRGGETMWGITVATARRYGYRGPMRDMPRAEAVRIYDERYFTGPGFDQVARLSPEIAWELTDTGVNMGPAWPSVWLQRMLNAFNRRQRDYANLKVDGDVGPATIRALAAYLKHRGKLGEMVMIAALNSHQGVRYAEITPEDDQNEDFIFGWFAHRVAA